MNFKNLAKITVLTAVLCINITIDAMNVCGTGTPESFIQSPQIINLVIQNNTDYVFKLQGTQEISLPQIDAHAKKIVQFALRPDTSRVLQGILTLADNKFSFTSEGLKNKALVAWVQIPFGMVVAGDPVTGGIICTSQLKGLAGIYLTDLKTNAIIDLHPTAQIIAADDPYNEINLLIILQGNEENNFTGSTAQLTIVPTIR